MKDQDLQKTIASLQGLLSRRSHSLQELKQKLQKKYSLELIEQALECAKQNNWLESEDALSEKLLNSLNKKNKSWRYIQDYFRKKGLPLPPYDKDKEIEKARQCLLKKSLPTRSDSLEVQQKARKTLFYRGFEADIIREVLSS